MDLGLSPISVSPAKAGVHTGQGLGRGSWIPAFAGKTVDRGYRPFHSAFRFARPGGREDGGSKEKAPYSGMLSCFFQGLAICLPRRPFRARAMRRRVPWGLMTSSM
jgi:hypothetical protein